jgi:hypothetical protein
MNKLLFKFHEMLSCYNQEYLTVFSWVKLIISGED